MSCAGLVHGRVAVRQKNHRVDIRRLSFEPALQDQVVLGRRPVDQDIDVGADPGLLGAATICFCRAINAFRRRRLTAAGDVVRPAQKRGSLLRASR